MSFEDPGDGYEALLDKCAALAAENESLWGIVEDAANAVALLPARLLHGDDAHRDWLKQELAFVFSSFERALAAWRASQVKG